MWDRQIIDKRNEIIGYSKILKTQVYRQRCKGQFWQTVPCVKKKFKNHVLSVAGQSWPYFLYF